MAAARGLLSFRVAKSPVPNADQILADVGLANPNANANTNPNANANPSANPSAGTPMPGLPIVSG